MRLRFGDCTFDGDTRQVERGGQVVHLSPKAFRLLELLLECRPKALSKADLCERIWPDTFVSEANLASLAAEVREALGDDSHHPRFLRTVYSFGYAFSGEVVTVDDSAAAAPHRRQCIIESGREIELLPGENIVGRDVDAAVRLDDPTVSRHHARITREGDSSVLEDLGSKNGTFVEGRRVRKPVKLKSGSVLTFGSVHVKFRAFSPESSTESAHPD
jgi:DNA-binding winged helix-turn-helix (wHTH) protein